MTYPHAMYELTVESTFAAAHAIRIGTGSPDGPTLEPLHGHNWHVTATIAGSKLDADGLLCDFHTVEGALREITGRFHNRNLNDLPPFAPVTGGRGVNPTAELVARQIATELREMVVAALEPAVRLVSVRVTEAPGCAATYYLGETRAGG